ncbi:MAG TPA: hypothetical protein VFM46_04765 [Pseudomonadales bacterium]|nr:hypothetical protein [Pseudomonadales bacterium]
MKSLKLKQLLHFAGSACAVIGIVFIAQRLFQYSATIHFAQFSARDWLLLGSLAITYGLANLLLAVAWWQLLNGLSAHTPSTWALKAFGISQIGKYVPGNIFHIAGRQALGMAAGIPAAPLAKSSLWELGLLCVAGGLFGALALPLVVPQLTTILSSLLFLGAITAAGALILKFTSRAFACAFILYIAFLGCSGSIFLGTTVINHPASPFASADWFAIIGAYVIAWLIGLLTPGAPAGVGIRELVLLFFLQHRINEAELVLAVILGRMITVGGDLLFYLCALAIKTQGLSSSNEHKQ